MTKIEISIGNFVDSIIDLDQISLWHIRTESGKLFSEYITNKYISLGWNYLTRDVLSRGSEENLKTQIISRYDHGRPGGPVNQSLDFVFQMKEGDLVLFPSESAERYCFAIVGDYYEEDSDISETIEKAFFDSYDSNVEFYNSTNPYVKRRHIEILKIIPSELLPPRVRLVLRNYGASMRLNEYKDECLGLIFPYFWYQDKLYLNFVSTQQEPNSLDYGRLLVNTSNLFIGEAGLSKESVDFRSNINSPGLTQFLISLSSQDHSLGTVTTVLSILFALLILLGGGEIKGYKVPSLLNFFIWFRRRKLNAILFENEHLEAKINREKLKEEYNKLSQQSATTEALCEEDKHIEMIQELERKGYRIISPNQNDLMKQIKEDMVSLGIENLKGRNRDEAEIGDRDMEIRK